MKSSLKVVASYSSTDSHVELSASMIWSPAHSTLDVAYFVAKPSVKGSNKGMWDWDDIPVQNAPSIQIHVLTSQGTTEITNIACISLPGRQIEILVITCQALSPLIES